jgi:hypothetical protein
MNTKRNQLLAADITAVCARVGLDALTVDADETEVRKQEDGAAVGFLDALEAAIHCLIERGDDESEYDGAPWDYVADLPDAFGLAPDAEDDAIATVVREVVNQPEVTVYLLGSEDYIPDGGVRGVFPPEYGETTDANWVFYVPLDAFSSLQWMIVDKAGKDKAYCYGHD